MRIWCIWDWHELLWLMSILWVYNHEYHLISDHAIWPISSKSVTTQHSSIHKMTAYAESLWLDSIIVPPIYESTFNIKAKLLPLFEWLVKDYVLPNSIVNKRWVVWDWSYELDCISKILNEQSKQYLPVYKQSNNRSYTAVPRISQLVTPQMKYHMLTYGKHDRMMRKSRKFELRTLKDAAIDTLIPANRSLLHREKIRRHHCNLKKIRVLWKKHLQEIFESATAWSQNGEYSITIHSTDSEGFKNTFLAHKKRRWMLERGKSIEIQWKII